MIWLLIFCLKMNQIIGQYWLVRVWLQQGQSFQSYSPYPPSWRGNSCSNPQENPTFPAWMKRWKIVHANFRCGWDRRCAWGTVGPVPNPPHLKRRRELAGNAVGPSTHKKPRRSSDRLKIHSNAESPLSPTQKRPLLSLRFGISLGLQQDHLHVGDFSWAGRQNCRQ